MKTLDAEEKKLSCEVWCAGHNEGGRGVKFFPPLEPKLHRASYFTFVYRPGTLCHKYLVFKTVNFYLYLRLLTLISQVKTHLTHTRKFDIAKYASYAVIVSFLHDNLRYGLTQHFALKQQHSWQHLRFRG